MNRFTRNNLFLIIIIACSCVAAVVLLVFAVIKYAAMAGCIEEIEKLRSEIAQLGKKKPSPVDANKAPIIQDTKLYITAAEKLQMYCRSPMRDVAEKFVAALEETKPEIVDGKPIKMNVEKFVSKFNDMWNSAQSFVDKEYKFKEFREIVFKNWRTAMLNVFIPEAQKYTTEPLDENNAPEVMLAALGVPRTMAGNPENMVYFMKNYRAHIFGKVMGGIGYSVQNPNPKVDSIGTNVEWLGFLDSEPTAASVLQRFNNPNEHFPHVAKVWDIYGDVIKRMAMCSKKIVTFDAAGKALATHVWNKEEELKLKDQKARYEIVDDAISQFYGIGLRAALGKSVTAENYVRALSGDDRGAYTVYRLRAQIGASLAGVRNFVRVLNEAYKERRMYVVKSIALYADQDGGAAFIKQKNEEANPTTENVRAQEDERPQESGRGRGRGRGRAVMQEKAQAEKAQAEKAAMELARKKMQEAAAKFAYYERIGYGDIVVGENVNCQAVIDFDYYVLK